MRGIDGPVKSMSRTPTRNPCRYKVRASCSVIDDFPTPIYIRIRTLRDIPPLPLRISIVCLIFEYVFVPFTSAIKMIFFDDCVFVTQKKIAKINFKCPGAGAAKPGRRI